MQYDLVFEGGGAKGGAFAGALRAWLITELDNPAIPNAIEPAVDRIMGNLVDQALFRHMLSLLMWGGWYSGKAFRAWLRERLDQDGRGLADSTLFEFYQKTGSDFSAVAADVSEREMLVLNHRTAPACPTVWAVRMSMGCPFAWPEVIWHSEWGAYRGRDLTGHKVVDGGLLSNFPIRLFVSSDENIDEIMGENSVSDNVIGMLIDETLAVPGVEERIKRRSAAPGVLERLDLLQESVWRIQGLADTVLGGNDRTALAAYQDMVCRLPAKNIGTLDFDMPKERMAALVNAGDAAMQAYLAAKG